MAKFNATEKEHEETARGVLDALEKQAQCVLHDAGFSERLTLCEILDDGSLRRVSPEEAKAIVEADSGQVAPAYPGIERMEEETPEHLAASALVAIDQCRQAIDLGAVGLAAICMHQASTLIVVDHEKPKKFGHFAGVVGVR